MCRTAYFRLRPPFNAKLDGNRLDVIQLMSTEVHTEQSGKLTIRVCYIHGPDFRAFGSRSSTFGASYDRYHQDCPGGGVRLTNGGFYVDPAALRGRGIGAHIMSLIVDWVKEHAPDAQVQTISLGAETEEGNVERRAKVYGNAGIRFEGRTSCPMMVSELQRAAPERRLKSFDLESEFRSTWERGSLVQQECRILTKRTMDLELAAARGETWRLRFIALAVSALILLVLAATFYLGDHQ